MKLTLTATQAGLRVNRSRERRNVKDHRSTCCLESKAKREIGNNKIAERRVDHRSYTFSSPHPTKSASGEALRAKYEDPPKRKEKKTGAIG